MKFEILNAKNGQKTLKINSKYAHSRFNPQEEAKRLVQNLKNYKNVIIIGSGLGYIEEELKPLKIDFLSLNHKELLQKDQFDFNDILLFKETLRAALIKNGLKSIYIYIHPVFKENFPKEIAAVLKIISYITDERRIDINTKKYFLEKWLLNYKENFMFYLKAAPVKNYFRKFAGKTALLAGAGPSLEKDIEQIKKYRNFIYIVAVDTALKYLVKSGIRPDFLLTMDAQENNLKDFEGVNIPEETICIFDVFVNSGITPLLKNKTASRTLHNIWDGEKYVEDENPFLKEFFNAAGDPGGLQCGGSVSTSAFHFCYEAGFKNIILAGQDLSFKDEKMHSSDIETVIALHKQNKFFTIELFNFLNFYETGKIKIKDKNNASAYTTDIFLNYKKWFEDAAEKLLRSGVNFFNITADGADIKGFQNADLKDMPFREKKIIPLTASRAVNSDDFKKRLQKTKNFINEKTEFHKQILFSGQFNKSPFVNYLVKNAGFTPKSACVMVLDYFENFSLKEKE